MLNIRKSRTVNGISFKFRDNVQLDRVTVTMLASENRTQRRLWKQAFDERGWRQPGETATIAEYWQAAIDTLGLKSTPCDECGMTVSYSVSGLVVCLEELLSLPILRVEYREASVSRGGRPQDYVQVSGRGQERLMAYIPFPHDRKPARKPDNTPEVRSVRPCQIAPDASGPWA